jgi:hypothetical protein
MVGHRHGTGAMDAEHVLQTLREGNRRFVRGERRAYDLPLRRAELLAGQSPRATVVSRSDSRVVPEFIFAANLGELFTVESAGNVLDDVGLGSVEYGIEVLRRIEPAVVRGRGDLDASIRENVLEVRNVVLAECAAARQMIDAGRLRLALAIDALETGEVRFFD